MKIYNFLISTTIVLQFIFVNNCYTEQKPYLSEDTKCQLAAKTKFSESQIESIEKLLTQLGKQGIPVTFLENRIREGIVKRVRFNDLYKVLTTWSEILTKSSRVINDEKKNKVVVSDYQFCIQFLSELIHRGFKLEDWNEIMTSARATNLTLDNIIFRIQSLVMLTENRIAYNTAKSVVIQTIKLSTNEFEKYINLTIQFNSPNSDMQTVESVLLTAISENKGVQWYKTRIDQLNQETSRREIREEVNKELQKRSDKRD